MRPGNVFLFLLILWGCAFVFLTGCPLEDEVLEEEEEEVVAEQDSPGVFTMKDLTVMNGIKYLSLSTGKTVSASKKKTTEWDIAVAASMFVFRTNSGVTAADAGSGGNAYIWYTDKTDFNDVTLNDRVELAGTEYEPYAQDVTRYYYSTMNGPVTSAVPMNMFTYFGFYEQEVNNGLTYETPFKTVPRKLDPETGDPEPIALFIFFHFNKKMAYEGTGGMPPGFKETKQIYIIRHADGVHHSKFQVTAFTYGYAMDLKFAPLD